MSNYKERIHLDSKELSDDALVYWASFLWGRIIEEGEELGALERAFAEFVYEARKRGITNQITQGITHSE